MSAEAYPLHWPAGWPRKSSNFWREDARFKTSFADARDELFREVGRMGGKHIVLSTNVELRRDGLPYASRKEPEDPGAAIYFLRKGKPQAFACDRWRGVKNNIQALRKTLEAIRGIERWGASDMMERAFTGFEALPDQSGGSWWTVLGVSPSATATEVESAYKAKRRATHPDRVGGSHNDFVAVTEAWRQYKLAA